MLDKGLAPIHPTIHTMQSQSDVDVAIGFWRWRWPAPRRPPAST